MVTGLHRKEGVRDIFVDRRGGGPPEGVRQDDITSLGKAQLQGRAEKSEPGPENTWGFYTGRQSPRTNPEGKFKIQKNQRAKKCSQYQGQLSREELDKRQAER